jgi:glycosyltransferase involved in cell wall biosynthesis
MILSIVIPSKNEENNIVSLLSCLEKQSFQDFDIILADANSSDNTVKNFQENMFFKTRTSTVEGGLPAVGRNNGAMASNSTYILFMDADVKIYDNDLIKKAINLLINKKLDLVTTNLDCDNKNVKFIYSINNIFQYLSKIDKPYSTGMFFLINKKTFDKLGGFNPEDKYAEDYNLSRKVDKNKFGIVNSKVYSDDRRFKKMGYFGVIKLFLKTFLNKNNEDYFKKNIEYF